MKNVKLVIVIVLLIITLLMFGVGIYTGLVVNRGIKNQVDFNRGDENVFVKITAKYDGPKLPDTAKESYTCTIDRANTDAYKDKNIIPTWTLGTTNFRTTETEISFTFTIENINGAGGRLDIAISDFAFDEEQKFETSYFVANDVESLQTTTGTLLTSNEALTLSVNDGKQISFRLVYQLKKFDTKFRFDNNIQISLTNVTANN